MRILGLILILCCLYFINGELEVTCTSTYDTEKYSNVKYTVNSASDCNSRLSDDEKKNGDVCCYAYYSKDSDYKKCKLLDKYQFKNFGKYWKIHKLEEEEAKLYAEIYKDMPASEKEKEDSKDLGDYHLDCSSNYIKLTLLSTLLFLL